MNSIKPDKENEIFRLAEEYINNTSRHIFLTGKAGTGKTTFLRHIRQTSKKNILIAAPTGVAAINAGGVTLHSLFQLSFEPFIPGGKIKDTFRFTKQKKDMLQQADVLVIDEVSMLRADVLDAIDATLKFARQSQRPFGGIQMLFIGDMYQLPPVVKDDEWFFLKEHYKSPFFFHSKAIERIKLVYLELKKIYRQREQQFIDLLNAVRNNNMSKAHIDLLNSRYIPNFDSGDKKYITLCTHNYLADEINSAKLAEINSELYTLKGEIKGDFPATSLPTDLQLNIKCGAQIIFIKNDIQFPRRYYNGKIGEVSRITPDGEIYVTPEGSNDEIKLEKETWRNRKYKLSEDKLSIEEEEIGSFSQYPLRLAWAITIHKSQGLTFENAIIDTGQAFAAGQVYVALSRCTSLDGIVLKSPVSTDNIRTDYYASEFSKSEKSESELKQLLEKSKLEFQAEQLIAYFDFMKLRAIIYHYKQSTEDKVSDELVAAHEFAESLYLDLIKTDAIARRHMEQLESLAAQGDFQMMKERSAAGAAYFYGQIHKTILMPLQKHKDEFKGVKKAKAYWQLLNDTEVEIAEYMKRLTRVSYCGLIITEGIPFEPVKINEIVKLKTKSKAKPAVKKLSSKQITYDMKRMGKTIHQIAKERKMSVSSVEAHLLEYVKNGELSASDIVPAETIEKIKPLILQAIETSGNPDLKFLKSLMSDCSYTEIKAVLHDLMNEIR